MTYFGFNLIISAVSTLFNILKKDKTCAILLSFVLLCTVQDLTSFAEAANSADSASPDKGIEQTFNSVGLFFFVASAAGTLFLLGVSGGSGIGAVALFFSQDRVFLALKTKQQFSMSAVEKINLDNEARESVRVFLDEVKKGTGKDIFPIEVPPSMPTDYTLVLKELIINIVLFFTGI